MSHAIYVNCTGITGEQARDIKARLRDRIRAEGAVVTGIFRNPISPAGHPYRFIRVHFTPKDMQ